MHVCGQLSARVCARSCAVHVRGCFCVRVRGVSPHKLPVTRVRTSVSCCSRPRRPLTSLPVRRHFRRPPAAAPGGGSDLGASSAQCGIRPP